MQLSFASRVTAQPFPAISETLLLSKLQVIMLERSNVFLLSSMCTCSLMKTRYAAGMRRKMAGAKCLSVLAQI